MRTTIIPRTGLAMPLAVIVAFILSVLPALAQQITGVPGSPDATETIDGRYLPAPPPKFGGEINVNATQSKPYWPARVVPPKGTPNILLIMTDDVGFATLAFNNLSGLGRTGTGELKVDGKVVATQTMERTVPLILQWDETFDIGADTGTPVDDHDYRVPFKFTGKLNKLTIAVDQPTLTPEDEKRLREAAERAGDRQ